jgi:hypothetical protein
MYYVYLTPQQFEKIAELRQKHEASSVSIYMHATQDRKVSVEFYFPHRYIIYRDGTVENDSI